MRAEWLLSFSAERTLLPLMQIDCVWIGRGPYGHAAPAPRGSGAGPDSRKSNGRNRLNVVREFALKAG